MGIFSRIRWGTNALRIKCSPRIRDEKIHAFRLRVFEQPAWIFYPDSRFAPAKIEQFNRTYKIFVRWSVKKLGILVLRNYRSQSNGDFLGPLCILRSRLITLHNGQNPATEKTDTPEQTEGGPRTDGPWPGRCAWSSWFVEWVFVLAVAVSLRIMLDTIKNDAMRSPGVVGGLGYNRKPTRSEAEK